MTTEERIAMVINFIKADIEKVRTTKFKVEKFTTSGIATGRIITLSSMEAIDESTKEKLLKELNKAFDENNPTM